MRSILFVLTLTLALAYPPVHADELEKDEGYLAVVVDALEKIKSIKLNAQGGVSEYLLASEVDAGKTLLVIPLEAGKYCLQSFYSSNVTRWEMTQRDGNCFEVIAGRVNYAFHMMPRSFRTPEGPLSRVITLHNPIDFVKRIDAEHPELWAKYAGPPESYQEKVEFNRDMMYRIADSLIDNRGYEDANRYLNIAVGLGSVAAMRRLGEAYRNGNGVKVDRVKAYEWYKQAADRGDDWASAMLCQQLDMALGVPEDQRAAVAYCRIAAQEGSNIGNWYLARMHARSRGGLAPNPDEEKRLMEAAGPLPELAETVVRWSWGDRNEAKEYPDAEEMVRLATAWHAAGSERGAFALGHYYQYGVGVPVDGLKSIEYFEKAAAGGMVLGWSRIGEIYWYGKVVPRDERKAIEYMEQYGEHYLGGLNDAAWYLSSAIDPDVRDGKRAIKLIQEAIRQRGETPAWLDTLAAAYAAKGDFKKAVEMQKRAIALGIEREWSESLLQEARERLALYSDGKPYVRKPPNP